MKKLIILAVVVLAGCGGGGSTTGVYPQECYLPVNFCVKAYDEQGNFLGYIMDEVPEDQQGKQQ